MAYWTPTEEKILKKLWNEGLTGSEIAAELKRHTRNGVIAKKRRMNLSGRPSPVNLQRLDSK